MDYTDNNIICVAVSDILRICDTLLPPDMNYTIRLEKNMRSLVVDITDKRDDDYGFYVFRYNERVSAYLNGECFREFLASIINI